MTAITTAIGREISRPSALLRDVVLVAAEDRSYHGYELAEVLGTWRPANLGQLYRLLRQLEDDGLLSSEWDYSPAGPPKRVYALTPAGKGAAGGARAGFEHLGRALDRYASRYDDLRRRQIDVADDSGGLGGSPDRSGVGAGPASERDRNHAGTGIGDQAVGRYLEILEARRLLPSSTKKLNAHLLLLETLLAGADTATRRQLEQRRLALRAAAALGTDDNLAQSEAAFIAEARAYSASKGITHPAWVEAGVDHRVLQAAGVTPDDKGGSWIPMFRDTPYPGPLLRCWLLLLVGERPRHGQELCEDLAATDVAHVDVSRVYRLLHRLVDEALVVSQWRASTRPGPERRVYSLTPSGHDTLDSVATYMDELAHALPISGHTRT